MGGKKDPAKFSIRFNAADPHQEEVIDLLNKQGRYKAQFITNAVRHYIRCASNPELRMTEHSDEQIMRIVQNCLSKRLPAQQALPQEPPLARPTAPGGLLDDEDRDSIMQTLDMFK